jgi:hypothetical protein
MDRNFASPIPQPSNQHTPETGSWADIFEVRAAKTDIRRMSIISFQALSYNISYYTVLKQPYKAHPFRGRLQASPTLIEKGTKVPEHGLLLHPKPPLSNLGPYETNLTSTSQSPSLSSPRQHPHAPKPCF